MLPLAFSAESDLNLLRRFADEGDAAAFGEIVRRYAGLVYGVSRRIVGNTAQAEDVSQETFLRLMTRPREVGESLGGWLHRAATRLAVDAVRSEDARARRETAFGVARSGQTNPGVPDWARISCLIDEALAALPDPSRELLVRHYLRGETQAALAAEGRISPPTLSRRVAAAVELLRRELQRRGMEVAPAVLGPALAFHATCLPTRHLLYELGKMTLLRTTGAALPVSSSVASRTAASRFRLTEHCGQLGVDGRAAVAACIAAAAILAVASISFIHSYNAANGSPSHPDVHPAPAEPRQKPAPLQ